MRIFKGFFFVRRATVHFAKIFALASILFSPFAFAEIQNHWIPIIKEKKSELIRGSNNKAGHPLEPHYESCKEQAGQIRSQLEATPSAQKSSTEAKGFCFKCLFEGEEQEPSFAETANAIKKEAFKEKLKKRVVGKIRAEIYKIDIMLKCLEGEFRHSDFCKPKLEELVSSVNTQWSKMRHHLALSSAFTKEGKDSEFRPRDNTPRFFTDKETWINKSPSHFLSKFIQIPPLSPEEKRKAEVVYATALSQTPLTFINKKEFKKKLLWNSDSKPEIDQLTLKDRENLKKAIEEFRFKNRREYISLISKKPLLGYVTKANLTPPELAWPLSTMKQDLEGFLSNISEKGDMGTLLSFNPLVEDLLKEESHFCLVAEQARLQAESDKRVDSLQMLGLATLALIPCLSSGPVGTGTCIGTGVFISAKGLQRAKGELELSFGKVLTGKDFETIAELDDKERAVFLEKVFIPLAFFGTMGTIGRAVVSQKRYLRSAARVQPSALKEFSPKEIEHVFRATRDKTAFTKEHLQVLDYQQMRAIHPSYMKKLKVEHFTPQQINFLSPKQFAEVRKSSLTKEQLNGLSLEHVRSIKPKEITLLDIDTLSPSQISSLSPQQFKKVSTPLAKLGEKQVHSLTPSQIQTLTKAKVQQMGDNLTLLEPSQMQFFTPKQIGLFNDVQLQKLTGRQIATLSPNQVREVTNLNSLYIRGLTIRQIKAIKPAQLKKLTEENMKLLTIEQAKAVTAQQARALSPLQIRILNEAKKGIKDPFSK